MPNISSCLVIWNQCHKKIIWKGCHKDEKIIFNEDYAMLTEYLSFGSRKACKEALYEFTLNRKSKDKAFHYRLWVKYNYYQYRFEKRGSRDYHNCTLCVRGTQKRWHTSYSNVNSLKLSGVEAMQYRLIISILGNIHENQYLMYYQFITRHKCQD